MALVTKVSPSLASVLPPANTKITGLKAGEAIAAGDACYINADGKVWRAIGTTLGAAAAKVDGFALVAAPVGEAVTLIHDVVMRYGSGLTPGARYFVALTAGALDTVATAGGTAAVAFAVDATRIYVFQSRY